MSVSVTYIGQLTVVETPSTGVADVSASKGTLTHDQWNTNSGTLTSSTTPAVTQTASFQQALSTGSATIDLTSLVSGGGASVSFNGLQVQFALFQNSATNANPITITVGASNGYNLNGASWKETIRPGGEVRIKVGAGGVSVDSSHKTLDLTGTGSQALNVQLVAG